MYFPRPYPDELIGSVVGRAARHLGLPLKVLLKQVLKRPSGQMSFFLPADLVLLGELTHTAPDDLALGHTVLPYISAFMTGAARDSLQKKVVHGLDSTGLSPLVKSVSRSARWLRYCPSCVAADTSTYGECYWHRLHLLPGIHECPIHGLELVEDVESPSSNTRGAFRAIPAHGTNSTMATWLLPPPVRHTIVQVTLQMLEPTWQLRGDWADVYKARASKLGYRLPVGDLASSYISRDLAALFHPAFLHSLGCPISPLPEAAWPALMARPGVTEPFAPIKHVLMTTFLELGTGRVPRPLYHSPGRKPADYSVLDAKYAAKAIDQWQKARDNSKRLTVGNLLGMDDIWSTFRHSRGKFPKTVAVIQEFRKSAQAERQVGRRTDSKVRRDPKP